MQVSQDILTPAKQAAEGLIERVSDADLPTDAVTNAASTAAAKVAEVAGVASEAIAAGQAKLEDATSDSPNWLRNSIVVTVIAAALAFAAVRLQRYRAQRANAAAAPTSASGPYR